MEICDTSGLPRAMVLRMHQSNGYIKRKLREWSAQKCNALVGAETALTCAGSQTTYSAEKGNMRNFGPTNNHGTVFAPKQWLHQKEDIGMER